MDSEIKVTGLTGIFDSHAHYDDEKFSKNRSETILAVHNQGISNICNVGADFKSCRSSINLAKQFDFIFCSVGIHPTCIEGLEQNWIDELENLAKSEKVVAMGEIGLDYFEENFSRQRQIEAFEKQLNLAQILNLPVIVHSRKALEDTVSVLKNFPKVSGVIHCFSENSVAACKYVEMGWKLGFTGVITFKNAKKTVEAALAIPINSLVVETDCPYMAPEPWRGSCCNSTMLVSVVKKIADIKKMDIEEVVKITRNNAYDLYNIKK